MSTIIPTVAPTVSSTPIYDNGGFYATAVALDSDGQHVLTDIGDVAFNEAFMACPIVRYTRNGEVLAVYKRIAPYPSTFDAYSVFTTTWISTHNLLHTDFEFYSSYENLKDDTEKWEFCNYDDTDVGFPRDCDRYAYVPFRWFSLPGGRFDARRLTSGASFSIHSLWGCPATFT
jgi:hypothetical protein